MKAYFGIAIRDIFLDYLAIVGFTASLIIAALILLMLLWRWRKAERPTDDWR